LLRLADDDLEGCIGQVPAGGIAALRARGENCLWREALDEQHGRTIFELREERGTVLAMARGCVEDHAGEFEEHLPCTPSKLRVSALIHAGVVGGQRRPLLLAESKKLLAGRI